MKNKRYLITNNSQKTPQVWSIDTCKLIKTYKSKTFDQVKSMMDNKYDLKPDQTPYPYSWFAVDIKLGCLQVHLEDDNWPKCTVSEMQTNIQLMMSSHMMDQASTINYDIEEKQINLGVQLVTRKLEPLHEEMNTCECLDLEPLLASNHKDFLKLYNHHFDEVTRAIAAVQGAERGGRKKEELLSQRTSTPDQIPNQTMSSITYSTNQGSTPKEPAPADRPCISMFYLQDKQTQKPLWLSQRHELLETAISLLATNFNTERSQVQAAFAESRYLFVRDLQRHLPWSMRETVKKSSVQKQVGLLSKPKDSAYNTNAQFKERVHQVLEFFGTRPQIPKDSRLNFCCKPLNPNLLPVIDQDSMNSVSAAKITDVADYIFFKDGLYKHVKDTAKKRFPEENRPQALDYIELAMVTNIPDEAQEGRFEFVLGPEITLDQANRYFFSLINIDKELKQMPLYFNLEHPSQSLTPARKPEERRKTKQ